MRHDVAIPGSTVIGIVYVFVVIQEARRPGGQQVLPGYAWGCARYLSQDSSRKRQLYPHAIVFNESRVRL